MLKDPVVSVLGRDPDRTHRINANSFQQNAITAVGGWQYAAFYTDVPDAQKKGSCFVNLARRRSSSTDGSKHASEWEILTFEDYEQTVDDGHNTICIGVCRGDGTIHVTFDHHCDRLRFRISELGTAGKLSTQGWNSASFTKTQDFLPGVPFNKLLEEVTYPTFVNVEDDLIMSYRIGQAGLGSDVLYRYSATTHQYTYLGQHLTGISNSPYINGIDYRLSRLHISWCYRNFISFPADALPNAHKQQAGPNGPENNYDLNYAYSEDRGETWKSSDGKIMAKLSSRGEVESTIKPGAEGARVFEIPMGSGILNQEAQAADWDGGFWAINRENPGGEEKWIVYRRDPQARWSKVEVSSPSRPTETGSRASICVDRGNSVYLVLPGNTDSSLSIMCARKKEGYLKFKTLWTGEGFDGEPCVDVQGLEVSNILSVFTRTDHSAGQRNVVVLDFDLNIED